VTWWGWHNGAGIPPSSDGFGVTHVPENLIFHTIHLGALEDSLRSRRWMRKLYDEELAWPDGYPIGWIPLMVSWRITLSYWVDALADEHVAPVYLYDHGGGTPHAVRPQFGSLAELIGLFVRIDTGVVTHDPFDPRLPYLANPPASDDVRRLAVW